MKSSGIVTIVPFFNRRHTILAALDSVESQTVPPDQLILIDDGSTDGGGDLVIDWMARSTRVRDCRLAQQANRGPAAARNYGLSLAAPCKYVAFLDSDDVWPPDFLERTRAALLDREDAVAATCDQQFVYADGRESVLLDCSPLVEAPSLWMMQYGAGIASCTLFRRVAVERRGGFPNLITGEDAALFVRLSLDGSWLHAAGEPVNFHRGLAQSFGDEMNLSDKYLDGIAAWIQIFEDFFTQEGSTILNHTSCCPLLARAWLHAGKKLYRASAPRAALRCFRKSRSWDPWRRKCYVWMLRSLLSMRPRKATRRAGPLPQRRLLDGHLAVGN